MVEREGDIITRVIPDVKRKTLEPHIVKHVKKGSAISTDELKSYKRLSKIGYHHESVNHKAEEFVRGVSRVHQLLWGAPTLARTHLPKIHAVI